MIRKTAKGRVLFEEGSRAFGRRPSAHTSWPKADSREQRADHTITPRRILICMIRKTPKGYVLLSKSTGKKLGGPYKTREQALKRERQVQFFKRRKAA